MKSLRRYKEKKYIESTAVNVTFEITLRESIVTFIMSLFGEFDIIDSEIKCNFTKKRFPRLRACREERKFERDRQISHLGSKQN